MPIALGESFSFDQSLPTDNVSGEIENEATTKIAILGAGLAGLTCAYRLAESVHHPLKQDELIVLEREAQPGGRIRSLKIENRVINLGAVAFQHDHYQRYMALLIELGLMDRIQIIPRRRMLFGYGERTTRADNLAIIWDALKGLVGRGVYSPGEASQLLRFYFFLRRVTKPENGAEFMALHQVSVAEWARQFGFGESLQRKFVQPFTHFCFRAPEEVSAAFGIFLLGSNLSPSATLAGGFGQIAEAMAVRLGKVIQTQATVLEVMREPDGFAVIYNKDNQLHRLHANFLVVALPANIAAQLVPEMSKQASQVEYGQGTAMVVAGTLKQDVDLQLRMSVGSGGTIIYGGEVKAANDGGHYANILTYQGENSMDTISKLFRDEKVEKLVEYAIRPASAAPKPGQTPLPIEWGDRLYMVGDCAGLFPSQETAVSTGEAVANLIKAELTHD